MQRSLKSIPIFDTEENAMENKRQQQNKQNKQQNQQNQQQQNNQQ